MDELFPMAWVAQSEYPAAPRPRVIRLDRQISVPHLERLELSRKIVSQLGDLRASKLFGKHPVYDILRRHGAWLVADGLVRSTCPGSTGIVILLPTPDLFPQ